jgi:uncharacterized membrane protein YdjX (TVP38/TMEM64 family)
MGSYPLLAISSGYIYKQTYNNIYIVLTVGTTSVFIGAWLGALIAFTIGRYFCRTNVKKMTQKYRVLKAIDILMETQGVKLIILLRMSILVPYNFSNYVFGGSAVKFKDFLIGNFGLMPLVIFYVYIGSTMSNIEDALSGNLKFSTTEIVVCVVGSTIALSGIVFATIVVRRILN